MLVVLAGATLVACAAPIEAPQDIGQTPKREPVHYYRSVSETIGVSDNVVVETEEAPATPMPTVGELPHWSGIGAKVTEPFTISEAPWVIIWEFQPDEPLIDAVSANILQVSVRQVGDESYLKAPINIVNVKEYEAGNSYIYDKGTFYLEINSMGGSWDILVLGFE